MRVASKDRAYILGLLLHTELLPGDWVSWRTILLLLQRLFGRHSHADVGGISNMAHFSMAARSYGQSSGKLQVRKINDAVKIYYCGGPFKEMYLRLG